jgi:hypothetical protein
MEDRPQHSCRSAQTRELPVSSFLRSCQPKLLWQHYCSAPAAFVTTRVQGMRTKEAVIEVASKVPALPHAAWPSLTNALLGLEAQRSAPHQCAPPTNAASTRRLAARASRCPARRSAGG